MKRHLAMLAIAIACAAALAVACGCHSKTDIQLYVLDGGRTLVNDPAIFGDPNLGPEPFELAVHAFLVRHPNGVLLWDTGHSLRLTADADRADAPLTAISGRPIVEQLHEIGLEPADVNFLVLSHMHADHTGQANEFASSTIIVQREEHAVAFGADAASTFGMAPATYERLADSDWILLDEDLDLFGDGAVRILRAPGHTPGSQMLLVRLRHTGPVLLSGDLYLYECQRTLDHVSPFHTSEAATRESRRRVDQLLKYEAAIQLWITHDARQMDKLRMSPAFYD